MDQETRECLARVIDYLWKDEFKSWREDGRPYAHIFNDLIILDDWLRDNE